MLNEEEKVKHAQIVAEKEEHLEMAIQSYMVLLYLSSISSESRDAWGQTLFNAASTNGCRHFSKRFLNQLPKCSIEVT